LIALILCHVRPDSALPSQLVLQLAPLTVATTDTGVSSATEALIA